MRLFHKRLLIFFSVALNIGFVAAAIVMFLYHPASRHERIRHEIVTIVEQLDLPANKERTVLNSVTEFSTTIDGLDRDLRQVRGDVIRVLAKEGPLDTDRFNGAVDTVESYEKKKVRAFAAHMMDMRSQLGDEKGALYFSLLLDHLEEKAQNHRR